MTRTRRITWLIALSAIVWTFIATPAGAVIVHDLRVDFSNANNPNGPWRYYKGSTLLSHFTPVSNATLALAVANGYWGDTASSNNSAIMLTTANGSATGFWSDADFLQDEVLVRTTDPSTGGPMTVTWTAPTSGSFTYAGFVWFAGTPQGPGGNSFTLSINNGPAIESGSAGQGQDRQNMVGMVNGTLPTNISAGDVISLQFNPLPGPPFGSLAGVSWTIDFQPVPEPSSWLLATGGGLTIATLSWRRKRVYH
jgi:hypothetical protein